MKAPPCPCLIHTQRTCQTSGPAASLGSSCQCGLVFLPFSWAKLYPQSPSAFLSESSERAPSKLHCRRALFKLTEQKSQISKSGLSDLLVVLVDYLLIGSENGPRSFWCCLRKPRSSFLVRLLFKVDLLNQQNTQQGDRDTQRERYLRRKFFLLSLTLSNHW